MIRLNTTIVKSFMLLLHLAAIPVGIAVGNPAVRHPHLIADRHPWVRVATAAGGSEDGRPWL